MPTIYLNRPSAGTCRHGRPSQGWQVQQTDRGRTKFRELRVAGTLRRLPRMNYRWKETKRYYELAEAERVFNSLAEQWRAETGHVSSISRLVLHPAYLQIIGMGREVVPMILRRLRQHPEFWFPALSAITREEAIRQEDAGNLSQMSAAWLNWGTERGLI